MFLLFAWIIVGATLVADGGGGQSDHSCKTALAKNMSDTRQTQVSHS